MQTLTPTPVPFFSEVHEELAKSWKAIYRHVQLQAFPLFHPPGMRVYFISNEGEWCPPWWSRNDISCSPLLRSGVLKRFIFKGERFGDAVEDMPSSSQQLRSKCTVHFASTWFYLQATEVPKIESDATLSSGEPRKPEECFKEPQRQVTRGWREVLFSRRQFQNSSIPWGRTGRWILCFFWFCSQPKFLHNGGRDW